MTSQNKLYVFVGFLFHLALIIFVIFKNRYYYNFLSKGHEVRWIGSRVDLRIVGKGAMIYCLKKIPKYIFYVIQEPGDFNQSNKKL